MLGPGAMYLGVLTLAGFATGGLALYSWRRRDQSGALALAAAMLGTTSWAVLELLASTETGGSHLFWERYQWIMISLVPLLFFFFMVDFTGHDWLLSRRFLPLFFVVPVATIVLALTNTAHHHLMWDGYTIAHTSGISTIDLDFGPWFWVYFAYAYTLQLIGFTLLLRLVSVSEYLYVDQSVSIVVGILAPLVGNAVGVFDLSPIPGLDPTPLGFSVLGLAFGNALFRYRLFELLPATRRLGRQAALVGLDDGVVIVDDKRTVLYVNPAAAAILDCEPADALGKSTDELVDTSQLDFAATDRLAELTLNDRTYEVETAPISDRRDKQVGHTILLYDVTERKQRERELRTQRDEFRQLERINTVIREVNQALVSATTVAELERTVVDTLATPDLYDDVWLKTSASDGPPVRMTAGDDEPGPADPEAAPPELASPDETDESATTLPTRDDLTADGGDWATVPVVYGRTVYGVLALHTDRETGFGDRELEVLDELGETVGHALTAIERTHLLVADTRVELDLQSTDANGLLVALADTTGSEWTLDGLVPATEGDLVAYVSSDPDGDDVTEAAVTSIDAAEAHPGVSEVRRIESDGELTLEVRASSGLLAHPLMESGANVRSATASDGACRLDVELSPDANVRAVVDRLREEFPETELLAKRDVEPTEREALPDEADLTDRQREALEAAFRAGYFEWPRDSTAEEVAEALDISSPTLHSHLRKAEGELVEEFFEG